MNDIVHIQPTDRISQGPSQIKEIILKVITNCAGTVFPTQDNSPGRLAFITLDSTLTDGIGGLAGWICVYMGLNPDSSPSWKRLLHVNSPPPTMGDFVALANAKQANLTGAATTIAANNLAPDCVVISNAQGKIDVVDLRAAELMTLDGMRAGTTVQAQIDGKQPNIVAATTEPATVINPQTNAPYPDGTVWLVYQ